MNKIEVFSEWLAKIEKDGIPNKKVFRMMWEDIIKRTKEILKANDWKVLESYIGKNRDTFSGHHEMIGPHAAKEIFKQIATKIWSLNRQAEKEERKNGYEKIE